jgi:ABC-2 type transport system ATP-binding protein
MLAFTRDKGRTVLLSSHLLDDVERLADRLAILDRGVLRVHARVDTFCERVGCWVLRFVGSPPNAPAVRGLVHSRVVENELHVTIANPDDQTESSLAELGAVSVARVPLSMENAILAFLRERGQTGSLLEAVSVGGAT